MGTSRIYHLLFLSISLAILAKLRTSTLGRVVPLIEIKEYTELFKYFHDIFAWSYEEYPGIDPCIIEHEIKTYPDAKLV